MRNDGVLVLRLGWGWAWNWRERNGNCVLCSNSVLAPVQDEKDTRICKTVLGLN